MVTLCHCHALPPTLLEMEERKPNVRQASTFHRAKAQFTAVVQREMQTLRAAGFSNADAQVELCHRLELSGEPIMAQKVDYMSRTFHLSIPAATLAAALQPCASKQLQSSASVSDVIADLCTKLSTPKQPSAATASTAPSSRSTDAVDVHALSPVGGKKRRGESISATGFSEGVGQACPNDQLNPCLSKATQDQQQEQVSQKRPRGLDAAVGDEQA